jgi:ppGpp synthetase/RelA/SpoT-type nucleotidyltranferase
MPLPITKSQLDKLGARLIAGITDEDRETLSQVASAYQAVLDSVKDQLSTLGHAATTRVKTTRTLVEKLRRESARLSQVQDLAGARIIVGDRSAQDDAVTMIGRNFEESGYRCRQYDRRIKPSAGYRAVHLVVHFDAVPVEI